MLWSILQIAALAYVGVAALIYFRQDSLMFLPEMERTLRATPADIGLAYDPLRLATADGETLDAWFVPAPPTRATRALVLFLHGNAGSIAHRLDYLRMFHALGLATLIFDYRGYGLSSGVPSEEGTYRDADAAWRHATTVLGFAPERIVVFGESLGGGVAAGLASVHPPGALVLASTFTSVPDLAAGLYPYLPVRLLARIHYDSRQRLATLVCPLLVIHSRDDDVIPFSHGQQLFAAARAPKRFLEIAGGHNDGFVFGATEWIRQLDDFLAFAGLADATRVPDRDPAAAPPQAPGGRVAKPWR